MIDFATNVRPFFQVVVSIVSQDFELPVFLQKLKEVIASNNQEKSDYKIITPIEKDATSIAMLIKHTLIPTWYVKLDEPVKPPLRVPYNVEYDILLVYQNDRYLFIHTNCAQVLTLVNDCIGILKEVKKYKFRQLPAATMQNILSHLQLKYRSLGIQNVYNAGGSAAEAKTYFGKDSGYCLTPSFDSGYGFSYCLGARTDENNKTFGCSTKKSKLWAGWVDDLDAFITQCDAIVFWITNKSNQSIKDLDVLILPADEAQIVTDSPIDFYLDYYAPKKGITTIGTDVQSLDWHCSLNQDDNTLIDFEILNDEVLSVAIRFEFNDQDKDFTFRYEDENFKLKIGFVGENDKESRLKDLVEYLNNQRGFTIIYENGLAYRDHNFWIDNRLRQTFKNPLTEIDWSQCDITKEDRAAVTNQFNILETIEQHFANQPHKVIELNDNGANEIGDYLLITNDKVILIHAKYSSSPNVGLRVEDIQVVASQAIKNIRYFNHAAYNPTILERLYGKCIQATDFDDVQAFKNKLVQILSDKDVKKECWIVQPGISSHQLLSDAESENKIHSILNFVHSILRVNQIEFKLQVS